LTGPSSDGMRDGPAPGDTPIITLKLATRQMPEADDFIRHKTTRRDAYGAFPPAGGCFDTVLVNRQGQLTEGTIGNLAVALGGHWYTPPLSVGLLPGVMRGALIAQGVLAERLLTPEDLHAAEGIALLNSVRGWLPARLNPVTA
jgi:para-aminobenzoate synthetase/4-amino-4-deoxychorismate lyase